MEKRTFAKLGDSVSLLGFGGMRFPLIEGTTEVDIPATEEMIDLAMKNGVNYYDTAYPYHEMCIRDRITSGVKLINMDKDIKVASIAKVREGSSKETDEQVLLDLENETEK